MQCMKLDCYVVQRSQFLISHQYGIVHRSCISSECRSETTEWRTEAAHQLTCGHCCCRHTQKP